MERECILAGWKKTGNYSYQFTVISFYFPPVPARYTMFIQTAITIVVTTNDEAIYSF